MLFNDLIFKLNTGLNIFTHSDSLQILASYLLFVF